MNFSMSFKHLIRQGIRRWGFDVSRKKPSTQADLLTRHEIDLLLDVGAARGSFAVKMRADGYRGRVISFEPLSEYFSQIKKKAEFDGDWQVFNMALGDEDGQKQINVANNLMSSSFLPMMDQHSLAAPQSAYVKQQVVKVVRLDSVWNKFVRSEEKVFLKIDAQGFEKKILEGGRDSLERVAGMQLELSLVPLYEGEETISSMLKYVEGLGFKPVFFENGFHDLETGHYLQADVVFFR